MAKKNNKSAFASARSMRRTDNIVAVAVMLLTVVYGIRFHWYAYYTFTLTLLIGMAFAWWRTPFLVFFYFYYKKERKLWGGIIDKYLSIIPE